MLLIDISVYEATVVPAILIILYVLKQNGLPTKYLPTISLGLGVGWCLVSVGMTAEGVLAGVLLGGLAVGIHSGTKNSVEEYLFGGKSGGGKEKEK